MHPGTEWGLAMMSIRVVRFVIGISCLAGPTWAETILFDASKDQSAGNADWVVDADQWKPSR